MTMAHQTTKTTRKPTTVSLSVMLGTLITTIRPAVLCMPKELVATEDRKSIVYESGRDDPQ